MKPKRSEMMISWFCRIILLVFYVQAMLFLAFHSEPLRYVLLQIFIGAVIFLRFRQKQCLFFVPDEILASLPYFWSISVVWHFSTVSQPVQAAFFIAFALSMLQIIRGSFGFSGGLVKNNLLLAIYLSSVFVILMAVFVKNMLPFFDLAMFRSSLTGIIAYLAGISISLSAFFRLLPGVADDSIQ